MHFKNFDAKLAPNLMQIQIATLQKINANRQMRCQKGAGTKMHKCLVRPSVKGASEKVNFQTDT